MSCQQSLLQQAQSANDQGSVSAFRSVCNQALEQLHAQTHESAAAAAIVLDLVMEILEKESFSSQDSGEAQAPMQRGDDNEPEAVVERIHGSVTRSPAPHILDAVFDQSEEGAPVE